jgi:hypothetical protein
MRTKVTALPISWMTSTRISPESSSPCGWRGLMASTLLDVEDLVGVIDGVLRAGASASVPSVAVLPRQPPLEI